MSGPRHKKKEPKGSPYQSLDPNKSIVHPKNSSYFGRRNSTGDDSLMASMASKGFLANKPVTYAKDGNKNKVILCGVRRAKAAVELGIQSIPAVFINQPAESVEAEILLIEDNLFNQDSNLSDYDKYALSLRLEELYKAKRLEDEASKSFQRANNTPAEERSARSFIVRAGISDSYLSRFFPAVKQLMTQLEEERPDLLAGKSPYEQITLSVANNLNVNGLGEFSKGTLPIYKFCRIAKSGGNPTKAKKTDTDDALIRAAEIVDRYAVSHFGDAEGFGLPTESLLQKADEPLKRLKLLRTHLTNIIDAVQGTRKQKSSKDDPQALLFGGNSDK